MNANFDHWPSGPMWLQEHRLLHPFLDHRPLHDWLHFLRQAGQVLHHTDALSTELTLSTQHHHEPQAISLPQEAWPMGLRWLQYQMPHWRCEEWRSLWHLGAQEWTTFTRAIPLLAHPTHGWIWWEFDLNDIYERSAWWQSPDGQWVYLGQSIQALLEALHQQLTLTPCLTLTLHDLDVDPHTRHWIEHLPHPSDLTFQAFVEPGQFTRLNQSPLWHPTQPILAILEEKAWLDSGILDLRLLDL